METNDEKRIRLELLEKLEEVRDVLDSIIFDCKNESLTGVEKRIDDIRDKLHDADKLSECYFD